MITYIDMLIRCFVIAFTFYFLKLLDILLGIYTEEAYN